MKKIFLGVLSLVLILTLVACGQQAVETQIAENEKPIFSFFHRFKPIGIPTL